MGDLRLKGGEIASLVDRRAAHMAVEVAIRTFRQAEGPMHVDPESRIGGRGPVGARGGRDDATNHRIVMPANRHLRQRRGKAKMRPVPKGTPSEFSHFLLSTLDFCLNTP
jgi:hypothetical protein